MVPFAAETIFHIGAFPVTNTILDTLFVDGLIVAGIYILNKNFSKIPSGFQNMIELVVEGFYNLTESISPKNVKRIFPYFASFFIFILLLNWSGLIPGFGTIGFSQIGENGTKEFIPFLRGAGSDINLTLALAIISVLATHIMSINVLGIKEYLSRYFSLNPIFLFVGFLEIISEFTKMISLSFRLFGNVYAGEVVLQTISGIAAFFVPIPFYALEIIVGLVQALVFAILTMAFMSILTTPHHEESHAKEVTHV